MKQYWGKKTWNSPWTRTQFMAELRKAGWFRPDSGKAVYHHADGGIIDIDAYVRIAGGVIWRQFAERRQLPSPDGKVPF